MPKVIIKKNGRDVLEELLTNTSKKILGDLHLEIMQHMISVFDIKESKINMSINTWNQVDTDKIYELLKIPEKPDKITPTYKKTLKQTNKALYQILKFLRKHSTIKQPTYPKIEAQVRSDLSVAQDDEAFCLLNDYHQILHYLKQKRPSTRKKKSTLHPDLLLILIAFDGVTKTGGDYEIARLRCKHVHLDDDARIEIPFGRKSKNSNLYQSKTYPVSPLSSAYLKILHSRSTKNYIFPKDWREKTKHKSKRKESINKRLTEIWRTVHPEKEIPNNWDVTLWIRLTKLSMSVLGTPYIVISTLSGKLNAAQLQRTSNHTKKSDLGELQPISFISSKKDTICADFDEMAEMISNHIFMRIREIILSFDLKIKTKPEKRKAADKIEILMIEYEKFLSNSPNTRLLIEWIIWTLHCQHYRKNKFSTFLTYFSILPCRLLPILGEQQISFMSETEWIELASFLASEIDYASSSKRQTIAHLKSLHTFLRETKTNIPIIDWSNYEFRIQKGIPCAKVVKPHEIENLLENISPYDPNWLVIILAFYGGFRCEEICGLKSSDFWDGYKLNIAWSKRHTSRRSVPIGWLVPENLVETFHAVLARRIEQSGSFLVAEKNGRYIKPNTLGKRVSRLLEKNNVSVTSIHALRHGFASWTLVRYFMLVDPSFCAAIKAGKVIVGTDESDNLFSDNSLQDLARTLGGIAWEHSWLNDRVCLGSPSDISKIAALLGHTNRYTPIQNYFNSMEWITKFYMTERNKKISNLFN